jgi:alpha-L-fucosidase 2
MKLTFRNWPLKLLRTFGLSLSLAAAPSCPPVAPGIGIHYAAGQLLDAFAPQGDVRPAAILIHGRAGNRRTHINQVLEVLEKAGWAWFSVDYRDAADVRAAIDFVDCPGRFNIAANPVLIGEDKGAAIALQLASGMKVRSVVAFATDSTAPLLDPQVPVLMFHGEADDESPIGPLRAACQSWAECTFVPIPKGIHNLENWHPDQWEWKEELAAWLRSHGRGLLRDIVFARPGGQALAMDAFLPGGRGPFPAVIVVHGGGWEAGDKQTYLSPILDALTDSRFEWFSIDYRLMPYVSNADQLEDVRAAIRYVRAHASRFRVDPKRISLLGESAGGQMVTQLASLPCPDCAVSGVVSLYGVYDFAPFMGDSDGRQMLKRIFGEWTLPMLEEASPIHHISRALPPMLLIQGTKDELYPGALAYDAALKKAGVPHQLVVLDGAPHGMENWVDHPAWLKVLDDAVGWLRTIP